mgnify:CR=1 FL=1
MELIDLHSHWGTERGYVLRSSAELDQQHNTWKSKPSYHTEEEMAAYFRANGVRAILDFSFTKSLPISEMRGYHDYAIETQRKFPHEILGHWFQFDPRVGKDAVAEYRRMLDICPGFVGLGVASGTIGVPAGDPLWFPFYELCIEARRPALIFVGTTGLGAGLRGGKGVRLDDGHPRHLDEVAARFPDLDIVAGRPAWPWQDEMIDILLHKANVWFELHGWSPKHLTPALKRDISRRLKDRVMFGADYPLFTYERLVGDWRADGYSDEILDKIFIGNARRFLATYGITV